MAKQKEETDWGLIVTIIGLILIALKYVFEVI